MSSKKTKKDILGSKYEKNFDEFYKTDSCKSPYSEIYRAHDKEKDKNVILKVISKEKFEKNYYKDYFLNQINIEKKINEVLKECKSDYIIEYYDGFETETSYIFEYEEFNNDLSEYIENEGDNLKNNTDFLTQLIISISLALSCLKENKIIHRDIKPSNIFMIEKEKSYQIKLGNFFTSTFIDSNDYEIIGTESFMAPEIAKGKKYNEECDIWSFGITIFNAYFGCSPIGYDVTPKTLMNFFYDENLPKFQTYYPSLDELLKNKLLIFDSKKRIISEDLIKFVLDENFMKDKLKKSEIKYEFKCEGEKEYAGGEVEPIVERVSRAIKVASDMDNFDIISPVSTCEELKYNNIIYFNTRYVDSDSNDRLTIQRDSDIFANETNGAFLPCIDSESLKLLLEEIESELKKIKNKNIKFNIITDNFCCQELFKILSGYQFLFTECIENVCIDYKFSLDLTLTELESLKKINNKITAIHSKQIKIIEFIKTTSSEKNKPFPCIKLVTYQNYRNKYYLNHRKLANFYGNIDEETYKTEIKKLKNFIDNNADLPSKESLKKYFEEFDLKKNDDKSTNILENIIKEYTKNTFHTSMNIWLLNFNKDVYDIIVYFAARLMFILNCFAQDNTLKFLMESILIFRGVRMSYSSLLPYIINIKKIIVLPAFTSTSKNEEIAEKFSGRKEKVKNNNEFSVIYYIENKYKENMISNGIDIRETSKKKNEREILFQPFSFYYLYDIKVDLKEKTADIYLEAICKKEILEEKIKKDDKKIKYDKENEIITI